MSGRVRYGRDVPSPDALTDPVVELTMQFVGINSVSPSLAPGSPGEAQIAEHLATRLSEAGYTTRLVVPDADAGRVSLVATRRGSAPGPTVVLNGHLDTVGVDGMTDPFTARLDDGRLHGRGSSDMKGGVAGLVVAAEALAARDVPGTVIVALVADEEDGSIGAEAVIAELTAELSASGERMDLCLIAEPTWLDVAVAHRGYAVVEVEFHGRAAHSSLPEESVDAILAMSDLLAAVSAADRALRDCPAHPLLGHGSIMTTVAHGGTAAFTVAASASLVIERRTLPGESPAAALAEIDAMVDRIVAATTDLAATTRLGWHRDAWEQDAAGTAEEFAVMLGTALVAVGSPDPARIGAPYWMESALWQAAGVPTVVCGPAGGGLHAIDEWVDIDQLTRFPNAVTAAVARFLEGSA